MALKEISLTAALIALLSGAPAPAQSVGTAKPKQETEFCIPNGNHNINVKSVAEGDQETTSYRMAGPLGYAFTQFAKSKGCKGQELLSLISQLNEQKVPKDTATIGKEFSVQFEDDKIISYSEKKEPVPAKKSEKEQPAWAVYETPLERQLVVKYLNGLSNGGKLEKSENPNKPCLNHYKNILIKLSQADQERKENPQKNPYLDLLDEINSQKAFSCVITKQVSEKTGKMPWEITPPKTATPTKPKSPTKKPQPTLEETVAQSAESSKPSTAVPAIKEKREVIPEEPKPLPKNYKSLSIRKEYQYKIFVDKDGDGQPDFLVSENVQRPTTQEDLNFYQVNKPILLSYSEYTQQKERIGWKKLMKNYAYHPDLITAKPAPKKAAQAKPKTPGLEKAIQTEPEETLKPGYIATKKSVIKEPVETKEPKPQQREQEDDELSLVPLVSDEEVIKQKHQEVYHSLDDLIKEHDLLKTNQGPATKYERVYDTIIKKLTEADKLTDKNAQITTLDSLLSDITQLKKASEPKCVPDGIYPLKVERAEEKYRRGTSYKKAGPLGTSLRKLAEEQGCPLTDIYFLVDVNHFLHTQGNIKRLQDWLKKNHIRKSETVGKEYVLKIKNDKIVGFSEKGSPLVDLVTGKKLESEQPSPEEKKVAQAKLEPTSAPKTKGSHHPAPEWVKNPNSPLPEHLTPKPKATSAPKTKEYLPPLVSIKKDGSKNHPELALLCENASQQQECKKDFSHAYAALDQLAASSEENSHQLTSISQELKELFKKYHVKPSSEKQEEESIQKVSIIPKVTKPETPKLESKLKLSLLTGARSGEGTETNFLTGAEGKYNFSGLFISVRSGHLYTDVNHRKATSQTTSEKKLLDDGITYKNTVEETSTLTSDSQNNVFVGAGVGYQIDLNDSFGLNLALGADVIIGERKTDEHYQKTIQLGRDNQPFGSPKTITQPEKSTQTTANFYPYANVGVCFRSSNLEACLEGELGTAGKLNYGGIIKLGFGF